MTAKPVTYLVNLSERDYIRKKNKWSAINCMVLYQVCHGKNDHFTRLPKIKAWIDENNPGDPLIPFSVALEERLQPMDDDEKVKEAKEGATSCMNKITQAGYASLEV